MKQIITLLLFFSSSLVYSQANMQELRELFFLAIEDESAATELNDLLRKEEKTDPLRLGYLGSSYSLLARHAWNPHTKWKYLQKGLGILDTAIRRSPEDLELRFLRFSIIYHLPDFLGYRKEEEEDREIILSRLYENKLGNKPRKVSEVIINFFIEKGIGNPEKFPILG